MLNQNSIEENSIEENSIENSSSNNIYDPKVEKIQEIMIETINTTNINNIMECCDYLDKMPFELIEYALRKTARISNPSWQYTVSILESYLYKGFKTVEEAKADDLNYKTKKQPKEETQEEKNKRKIKELEEAIANDNW